MKTLKNERYAYVKRLSSGGQGAANLVIRSGEGFAAKTVSGLSEDPFIPTTQIAALSIPNTLKIIKRINADELPIMPFSTMTE